MVYRIAAHRHRPAAWAVHPCRIETTDPRNPCRGDHHDKDRVSEVLVGKEDTPAYGALRHAGDGPCRGVGPDRRMRQFRSSRRRSRGAPHRRSPLRRAPHLQCSRHPRPRRSRPVRPPRAVRPSRPRRRARRPARRPRSGFDSCVRKWRHRRHVLLPAAIHEHLRAHLPAVRLSRCVGLSQRASGRRGSRPRGRLRQAHGDAPARGDRPQRAAHRQCRELPGDGVPAGHRDCAQGLPAQRDGRHLRAVPVRCLLGDQRASSCAFGPSRPVRVRPRPRSSFPARSHWDGSGRT